MSTLTLALVNAIDGGLSNSHITSDLETYAVDYYPTHASDQSVNYFFHPVNNLPVSAAPKALTVKKPAGYYNDFYEHIHFSPDPFSFGDVVEVQSKSLNIWNAFLISKTLSSLDTGDSLLEMNPVPTVLAPLESYSTNLIASPGGTDNLDATMLFTWSGIPVRKLHVTGTRVAVFPYQARPQWQEVYEWVTDVIKSVNGTEQRTRLRQNPRITLNVEYPIPLDDKRRANNLAYGWLKGGWILPIWTDILEAGPVSRGATSLAVATAETSLLYADKLVVWESYRKYEAVNVVSNNGSTIVIEEGLTNTYANPIILAAAKVRPNTGIVRSTSGYSSVISSAFRVLGWPYPAESVPSQYKGEDVCLDLQFLAEAGTVTDNYLTRVDEVSNQVANSEFFFPWTDTQQARIYNVNNDNASETLAFKRWLARRAGKQRPFWSPTFEEDFRLQQSGNISTGLICQSDSYSTFASRRTHIAIQFKDGTWAFREIINHTTEADGLYNLSLDTPLNVDASTIRCISYFGLKRLDTDRVEIYYPGAGISYSSLRIVEIQP